MSRNTDPMRTSRNTDPVRTSVLWLLLVVGCAGPPPPEPAPAAAHAVHAESLRRTMDELRLLSVGRLPQSLDPAATRDERLDEFLRAVEGIADAAARIPEAAGSAVAAADREEFLRLSEALRRDARELAQQAPQLSDRRRWESAQALMETCQGCHQRFRIPLERARR